MLINRRRSGWLAAAAVGFALAVGPACQAAPGPVRLYAAGSLHDAMTEIAATFSKDTGITVTTTFGASGLLRERIEKGEPAAVFASADTGHPLALMRAGRAGPVVVFARNRLCALARPGLTATSDTLLDVLIDPAVKVGTSTPKADPAGDYTWALFEKAEKLRPGSFARLDAKAVKVMGGPTSPPPPQGRNLFAFLFEEHQADLVLVYCTSAMAAAKEIPGARVVAVPDALSVGADYGLTVIAGGGADADRFALYVLSAAGQTVLAKLGFTPVSLPASEPR